MKHVTPRLRRIVFGCAVAAGLAAGATQVVASPGEGQVPRACNPVCKPDCGGFGGELRHWGCLCCG